MTILVYGKPGCVQCKYTKQKLDEHGVPYTDIDLEQDKEARAKVEATGKFQLPMVEHYHGDDLVDRWHGFKIEKIKGLSRVQA